MNSLLFSILLSFVFGAVVSLIFSPPLSIIVIILGGIAIGFYADKILQFFNGR